MPEASTHPSAECAPEQVNGISRDHRKNLFHAAGRAGIATKPSAGNVGHGVATAAVLLMSPMPARPEFRPSTRTLATSLIASRSTRAVFNCSLELSRLREVNAQQRTRFAEQIVNGALALGQRGGEMGDAVGGAYVCRDRGNRPVREEFCDGSVEVCFFAAADVQGGTSVE